MLNKNPKVSVCMITYNHENYIEEAILSVLSQTTTFDIELIIGNDCSTDETHSVIEKIINTHPEGVLIKYFNHQKNLGIAQNFHFVLKQAKGDYIAILEGDDYWLDTKKLQKQVDFLDQNEDYNLISNEVKEFEQHTNQFIQKPTLKNSYTVTYSDILEKSHTHTCTLLIRNRLPEVMPQLFFKEIGSDRSLCLLILGLQGKGLISNDITAVYRLHSKSITRIDGNTGTLKNLNNLLAHIRIAKDWNNYFGNNNNDVVKKVKEKRVKQMLILILKRKHFKYLYMVIKGIFY